MNRIVIIGSGGAGKSTLARQLAAALDLPLHHLDALYWRPGWQPTPDDEFDRQIEALLRSERWIIDGNYGRTLDRRLAAADTIVWLDFPRWVCLWRICKRRILYHGRTRPDLGPGCPEKIDWEFLAWVWNFPRRHRPSLVARVQQHRGSKRLIHLRSAGQVRRFLNDPHAEATGLINR